MTIIRPERKRGNISPLRYPGGKAIIADFLYSLIQELQIENTVFVEPYAGGAGAGLTLLMQDKVEQLVLNDSDPAVYTFWKSILEENDRFVSLINDIPLTIDEWKKQREIYRARDLSDPFSLGFAFFYLNRTNRSGILDAGVIGGLNQDGNYRMDARFNRQALINRVSNVGARASQIEITNDDGIGIISQYVDNAYAFIYIDPPYVKAGEELYPCAFNTLAHTLLARSMDTIPQGNWLITYDNHELIRELYENHFQCYLELPYSVDKARDAQELIIAGQPVGWAIERTQRVYDLFANVGELT